eukprot:3368020-Amphidinium_carterae.1
MHANIDPSQFPPVAEVSAPAFSGPAHKLITEQQTDAPSTASPSHTAENAESGSSKAMPKAKAAPKSLLRPEQPFSQYTSYTCHDPLQEYTPDGPTGMMLAPEDQWLSRQIVLCKSGPKPWCRPKDYGSSEPESLVPILPNIPSDVMAQEVDLSKFPTFDDWKDAMWAAPYVASHQVE